MLNTRELEHRWLRYKIKSYIPHFSIGVSLLIIIFLFINFLTSTDKNLKKEVETTPIIIQKSITPKIIKKEPVHIVDKQTIIKKEATNITTIKETKKDKVKLSPSLDFMKKMQNAVQPNYQNEVHPIDYSDYKSVTKVKAPVTNPITEETFIAEKNSITEVNKVNIHRKNTQNDILEIIQRFKKSHNPVLSLFIAKKYYELGKYREAYDYALKTNNIDKNIERSWIIFSKSLVKMGKKNKAINTLKTYIRQSHSSSAQILLNEIKAGKFK